MKKRLFLLLLALLFLLASFCSCEADRYRAEGIENYDLAVIRERYSGDLDSSLAVFPSAETLAKAEATYEAQLQSGLFDTDAEIFLDCVYSDDATFACEIERLASLFVTISFRDERYTNYVRYDEDSYPYPAYVTIDGFGHTYEYALIIAERQEIVYLYLSYPGNEQFSRYGAYIKNDRSVYGKASLSCFSMYNHSFDGGKTYIEFDD